MMRRIGFLVSLMLLLAGCASTPSRLVSFRVGGIPSILSVKSLQPRLVFKIAGADSERKVQSVAGLTFDTALLELSSATPSFDATKSLSISSASTSIAVFTGAPAGTAYKLDVSLRSGGIQVGHTVVKDIALVEGVVRTVTAVIGQDQSIKIEQSVNSNYPADTIVIGDPAVTLRTGFAANEAGVDKMEVVLNSTLYGIGVETGIATVSPPLLFDKYVLDTSTASATATASFEPSLLHVGCGTGSISFRIYNGANMLGETQILNVKVSSGSLPLLKIQ